MRTELALVVDRSGSMSAIRDDMEGGLNRLLADQRVAPGVCHVTLTQFNDEYEILHDGVPAASVPRYELVPRGSTALLDAFGRTVHSVERRLGDLPDAPDKVVFVVVTDGHENASREFKKSDVAALVAAHPDWEFVFLGANMDAIAEAGGYGMRQSAAIGYAASGRSVRNVLSTVSANLTSVRSGGAADMSFTEEQRAAQTEAEEESK